LTLVELLTVSAIMVMLAGTLATLAMAVQTSNAQQQGTGLALQHGRVAIERIQRALHEATANEQFPGFVVFAESTGGWAFPDTLVVWKPDGTAIDPDGLPRMNELVVFCTDVSEPNQLLEIRVPTDTRTAPQLSNTVAWAMELVALKGQPEASRAKLTNLLRVAAATDLGARGCVRFEADLRPSAAEWAEYESGARDWEDISWAQGIHGATTGLRQSWCRIELQLRPADVATNDVRVSIPFFGSGAVYYELHR
jgi:type II secretory pathway pseudopilin PulG